jgi:hypothetical protein
MITSEPAALMLLALTHVLLPRKSTICVTAVELHGCQMHDGLLQRLQQQ